LVSERVLADGGYTAEFAYSNDWGNGFEGTINLKNTGDKPLEAWTISFDANFRINTIWNGKLREENGGRYTISSEEWTNPLSPTATISIGFTANKASEIVPEISNVSVTKVQIGGSQNSENPGVAMEIYAWAEYADGLLNIYWQSSIPNGVFTIYESDDGINFTEVVG
jgi:hypothetical protein